MDELDTIAQDIGVQIPYSPGGEQLRETSPVRSTIYAAANSGSDATEKELGHDEVDANASIQVIQRVVSSEFGPLQRTLSKVATTLSRKSTRLRTNPLIRLLRRYRRFSMTISMKE